MSKTLIFVEAKFDVMVVEKIIEKLGKNLSTNTFAIALGGEQNPLQPGQLRTALKNSWNRIFSDDITKIARICDIDDKSIPTLETSVNIAIQQAFELTSSPLLKENVAQSIIIPPPADLRGFSSRNIEFICHFVGTTNAIGNRTGELENLLRLIAKQPAHISNCVDNHLPTCLAAQSITLKNLTKSRSKLWLYNYQRFDTGNIEKIDWKEAEIAPIFNDMFDLNANISELQALENCIAKIAQ